MLARWSPLLTLMFAAGCGTGAHNDAGHDGGADAGHFADAGVTDAGVTDAGVTDAGVTDAGLTDAGLTDAGVTDAGAIDAGADAGATDAGVSDAGAGPPDAGGTTDAGSRRLVFLNFCADGGCTFGPGFDDSRLNTSGVVQNPPKTITTTTGPMARALAASCLRALLAPYDVVVTETDPAPAPHIEVVAAGTPQQLGFASGVSYVATMNCAPVENGIGFAFVDLFGNSDPDATCQAIGQAWGSVMGLEAVAHCPDVMGYAMCGPKSFTDADAGCGTFSAAACTCPMRTSQNSHQFLLGELGAHP